MADVRRSQGDPAVTVRREGGNVRHWILGSAIALLVIIALQNSQKVKVEFLFVDTQTPLIVALLIAGALGAVIGYTAPILRSHRREQRRQEHPEENRQ